MTSTYVKGESLLVRIQGHKDPVRMIPILRQGFNAGGGVLLAIDRKDGEIDHILATLNNGGPCVKPEDPAQ